MSESLILVRESLILVRESLILVDESLILVNAIAYHLLIPSCILNQELGIARLLLYS
ncbi:MAG: hypothetical protein V7L09_32430 [Nostoc sp.]